MGECCQGWSETWKPQGTWIWAVLASLLLHGLLAAGVLTVCIDRPAKRRVVVPVEALTLVPMQPGPKGGGGGQPAPVTKPEPVAPKPAPRCPQPQPPVKPKPPPKVKPAPPLPEPTATPAISAPARPPALTRGQPSPTASVSGSGQGGQGGGRGTGAGGGVGPGQGRGSGSGSALSDYLREVRRLLEQHKDYPWMARRRNIQGVVVMVFTITSGGQIESYRVSRSSGQDLLDEAARDTLRRVGRFPPFLADLNRQKLTIEIPLAFRLHND